MTTLAVTYVFTPATTIVSSQVNTNYADIITWSTQITNGNIKTGAAIDPAKLDLTQPFPVIRAATLTAFSASTTGDTVPRWKVTTDGFLVFGVGGGTAMDIMIKRLNSTTLAIRDAADSAYENLTVGTLTASTAISSGPISVLASTGTATFGSGITGDANFRVEFTSDGGVKFGPGTVTAVDTLIKRDAAASVQIRNAADSAYGTIKAATHGAYAGASDANAVSALTTTGLQLGVGGGTALSALLKAATTVFSFRNAADSAYGSVQAGTIGSYAGASDANAVSALTSTGLQLGVGGGTALSALLKAATTVFSFRNAADSAYATLQASTVGSYAGASDANPVAQLATTGLKLGVGGGTAVDSLIKSAAAVFSMRNAADSAYADVQAKTFGAYAAAGAANPVVLVDGTGGNLEFGPGGASAVDVALSRVNNHVMKVVSLGSGAVIDWYCNVLTANAFSDGAAPETIAPINGRLSLSSGVPVTTADVTAATTLYFTPYQGNALQLFDGTNWVNFALAEINIAVPATLFRIYDAFIYSNSGAPTIELNAWDSGGQTTCTITGATGANPCVLTANNTLSAGNFIGIAGIVGTIGTTAANGLNGKVFKIGSRTATTITLETGNDTTGLAYTSGGVAYLVPTSRTDAISLQNGRYVKTGTTTRLYVGSFMTTGTSGQTEDSTSRRLLWNYYNRVSRYALSKDTTANYTYSTATNRPANNNTAAGVTRNDILIGVSEDEMTVQRGVNVKGSSVTGTLQWGIGDNSYVTDSSWNNKGVCITANSYQSGQSVYTSYPVIGYHAIYQIEQAGSPTTTWGPGDGNAQTVIHLRM